ncbi:MAG: hypothetical protein J6S85_19560 [Methanobrevibacter sp.]|nr:hypothetical protein [Methanobrevibacter sp.]
MVKDAPSLVKKKPLAKATKQVLQDSILSQARESIQLEDGRVLSKWDALIQRQFDIALYAESNADATASAKWLSDRILGKPAVSNEKEVKPIPKVIFSLDDSDVKEIQKKASEAEDEEEEPEENFYVETDTGEKFLV